MASAGDTLTTLNSPSEEGFALEVKTVQSAAFRILIEALKEILTDANLEFDETGLKIMAMDTTHTVLVHLKLKAEHFESFHCARRFVLGVNMIHLFKLIKTMGNNDSLTLYMEDNDPNRLGIKIENGDLNKITTYKLRLIDLDEETINIPATTFSSVITMPSTEFQKTCRDMHSLSDKIEIESVNGALIFKCMGDFAKQETIMGESDSGIGYVKSNEEIVQGVFLLRHLVLFTKCTNLCNTIEIYLKNDYPLIIKYTVASLGEIKLCLAPIRDSDTL